MNDRTRIIVKRSALGLLIAGCLILVVSRLNTLRATGEERLGVWFYDLSEKRLYAAPRDTIPPHAGVGGEANDGVRAVVVACRAEQDDPAKRRIAYLETYTAELKALLERLQEARAAGRPGDAPAPARDSDFYQKNTLVRRQNESVWHDLTGAEAAAIMSEWRGCSCADGQPQVVCTP